MFRFEGQGREFKFWLSCRAGKTRSWNKAPPGMEVKGFRVLGLKV